MKQRSIAMCILLSIVTCGIYSLYWFVCITDDTNEMADEHELEGGGMALLLTIVTCGIYGWYWAYKMGEKVDIIKNKNGNPSSNTGILFVVLQFFQLGIINYALTQDCINNYSGSGNYGNQPYQGYNQNMNGNQPYQGYNQNMNGNQSYQGLDANLRNDQPQQGYDQSLNPDKPNDNNPFGGQ